MPDYLYLACVSADMPAVPNSVQMPCGKCKTSVWVSLSGQTLLRSEPKTIVVCIPCMSQIDDDDFRDTRFRPVPGGVKEALKYLRTVGNAHNN